MANRSKGKLLIIGGGIGPEDSQDILEIVAAEANGGILTVIDVATNLVDGIEQEYKELFGRVGIQKLELLDIRTREDAFKEENVKKCANAAVLFFTGGDQLRITSQMGDSPVFQCMHEKHGQGMMIAGTSAGAAAMPTTMIVGGPSDESGRISALAMAPGLGLLDYVVIDSHFAERGRMGRLLGAVVQHPANLGVGIDENTAILVESNKHFYVVGEGAVYVVDGSPISYSSLSESQPEGVITLHDVKLHVLGRDDCFDLVERRPVLLKRKQKELERATGRK
jgi:cyanophycinase